MSLITAFNVKERQSEIINYLRSYFNTAKISLEHPSKDAVMPYITVSMRTEPTRYSLNYNEVAVSVSVEIRVWDKTKIGVLDIISELGEVMRQVGFGRTSQTTVVTDGTIGKYTKSEIYRAYYNNLTKKYQLR